MDGLEKLFGQDLTDEHFISTNINISSFKFAIDRLADRRVNLVKLGKLQFGELNDVIPDVISVRGRGPGKAAAPPVGKKLVLFGQN